MTESTSLSEWMTIMANIGFPISITLYLFIRFEKRIEKLELSISELISVIKSWGGR